MQEGWSARSELTGLEIMEKYLGRNYSIRRTELCLRGFNSWTVSQFPVWALDGHGCLNELLRMRRAPGNDLSAPLTPGWVPWLGGSLFFETSADPLRAENWKSGLRGTGVVTLASVWLTLCFRCLRSLKPSASAGWWGFRGGLDPDTPSQMPELLTWLLRVPRSPEWTGRRR